MSKKKSTNPVMTRAAFHRLRNAAYNRLAELDATTALADSVNYPTTPTLAEVRREARYLRISLKQAELIQRALYHPGKYVTVAYRKVIP